MDTSTTETPIATMADVKRLAEELSGLGIPGADALTIAGHALTGGAVGEMLFALCRAGAIEPSTILAAYRLCRAAA